MNFKNLALFSLLLLTTHSCFTNPYRTLGRRLFKTIGSVVAIPAVMSYAQYIPSNEDSIAHHEAAHAVIGTKLNQGRIVEEATLYYGTENTRFGSIAILKDLKILVGGSVRFSGKPTTKDQYINFIQCKCAGAIQDSTQRNLYKKVNFIEDELHLPITKRPTDDEAKFNNFLENSTYEDDRDNAYAAAMILARIQLKTNNDNHQVIALAHNIVHQNFIDTIPLVEQYQPEIKLVGEALAAKNILTGDEIRELIKSAKK